MASPPFEVEDQLDEEFFDKLVNDDDDFDFTELKRNLLVVEATASKEVKASPNLSTTEISRDVVGSGGKDIDFGLESEKGGDDGDGDDVVANGSSSLVPGNVNEYSEKEVGEEGVLDSVTSKSDVAAGTSVKEVQGSSFHLDTNHQSGDGVRTYAEIFNDLGDNSEDPFAEVGNKDDSAMEFNASGGVSGHSVSDLASSSYLQNNDVQYNGVGSEQNVDGQDLSNSQYWDNLYPGWRNDQNSEDPFAELGNKDDSAMEFNASGGMSGHSVSDLASSSYLQNNDIQYNGAGSEQNVDGQDLSNSQYWENLYPGWRYDQNTGQWYQVEGYDVNATVNSQESLGVAHSAGDDVISNQKMDMHSLQQTDQSVMGTVAEDLGNSSTSNWNQISQGNAEYPAHMVFDPQYPGWYYDTIAQEWKTLESYTPAIDQSATSHYNQQYQNKNVEYTESHTFGSEDYVMDQGESAINYHQKNSNGFLDYSGTHRGTEVSSETEQLGNLYNSVGHADNAVQQQNGFEPSRSVSSYEQPSQAFPHSSQVSRFQSFIPAQSFTQLDKLTTVQPDLHMQFTHASADFNKLGNPPQQPLQMGTSFSSSATQGRSSAGRPPHALVTFGFGGKLIVMRSNSLSHTASAYGNQGSVGGVVNILNLMEVVMDNSNASSFAFGAHDYFQTLCQQSFPGPLVGGNSGNKELYKWIDERIANCESLMMGCRGEALRLLFSLLKISCQYYGKLRSPFGPDQTLKESDCPELAIAKLLGSVKGKGVQSSVYGALSNCLQDLPSEAQMQATALEVQRLLVSGRKKEALEFAQEGQLWGPALVIASQLGDQFYGDTVKLMALKQLGAGSPLRTLCLLIAGQPADVFSTVSQGNNFPGYENTPNWHGQVGANMLDGWEENLAIIMTNRTKDDELVIMHLGDCLWRERSEVAAAHICYLVAEANFEPYSDSARLCLIGADHWNCPRTYVSPEAIQRTELYEYSKVLGNSQYILLPFQPYKLIYAYMLAEVGKVADSLKYCQAILKSSKPGRAPEVETWKQLVTSLEERLRIHQQGGYNTNLTPTKLVGKFLTFFDSTANRVVGGQSPPLPSTLDSSIHQNELAYQPGGSKAPNSQPTMPMQFLTSSTPMASTMAMPSLMPSSLKEPINEWTDQTDLSTLPSRSTSEPNYSESVRKVNVQNRSMSSETQEKAAVSTGQSRFGRFGSQIFQKTFGLVLRSRTHNQAKLGEANKFYYDEKLKRWVEEGADPPAEEAALPPPPTTAAFQNGMNDLNAQDTGKTGSIHTGSDNKSAISSEQSSGIPPIPPTSNQYSARARIGVRSRYVDTFSKSGGSPVNLFQAPSVPSANHVAGSTPKFFIPSPVTSTEDMLKNSGESMHEGLLTNESSASSKQDLSQETSPSTSTSVSESLSSFSSSSVPMQRFPSMDNIVPKKVAAVADSDSRRIASWSGSLSNASNLSTTRLREDLHEIKL